MYFNQQIDFTPHEVINYLRKSRSDDPNMSVEEVLARHEAILDEWCRKNLGEIVPEENKYREVVSGETLKERPEINKALKRIESPKIKGIAVVEPQRLTRGDLEDIGRLMKLLKHTHTFIITPQKIYDLNDEYDWDAFERELKRGNDYLEYTKKILSRGRLLSVSQGNYIASLPPYGYDKIWVMDGKRKCPTLAENTEQANVVRMIFDLYVNQDMGPRRICSHLESMGIAPPRGIYWSPYALKDMLANEHYIGKVKWNWRKTQTVVEDSEIIKTRPKAKKGEYLLYDGKHKGIIPEELFYAAQEKQGKNHRTKAAAKVRNPFASLLFCQCGRAMNLKFYKHCQPRMMCGDQVHCKTGSCTYEEMVDRVRMILEKCIDDFQVKLKNYEEDSGKLYAEMIKNLERKMRELEEKELSQWEAQSHPDPAQRMPPEIFKRLNEKLLKEKEEVRKALQNAYESTPDTAAEYEEKVLRFQNALSALLDTETDAGEKNRLLKTCIERIDYRRGTPERKHGIKGKDNGLKAGANWSNPPFEIDVELKV